MRRALLVVGLVVCVAVLVAWGQSRRERPPEPTHAACHMDWAQPPDADALACYQIFHDRGYRLCPVDAPELDPGWLAVIAADCPSH